MSDARLFAVKMRAARAGEHISGAERIVPAHGIPALAAALVERALHHAKGEPDEIHLKVEEASEIVHLEVLPVSTHVTQTPEEGRACAARLLADAGITRIDEIMARFAETYTMRGAMLLDADTLERLEPDCARGVRATYMDAAGDVNGQDARCPSGTAALVGALSTSTHCSCKKRIVPSTPSRGPRYKKIRPPHGSPFRLIAVMRQYPISFVAT